jgi:nucleoside-diphosphate-sugar epimerase
MSKILITGGAGFIGSQLGYYLHKKGNDVVLLDNMEHGHEDNLEIDGERFGTFVNMDIRDKLLANEMADVDYVVHLAGVSSLPRCQSEPAYAIDVNVGGTANVLEACRRAGVKRMVFASTGAVYEGNDEYPQSEDLELSPYLVYPMSKYNAEIMCDGFAKTYGLDICTIRFFNVYGPHQDFKRKQPPFTGYLLKQLMNEEPVRCFSDGTQKRDYVHVDDLTRLIEECIVSPYARNQTFNASSGEGVSVQEILDIMMRLFDVKVDVTFADPKKYWDNFSQLHIGEYPISRDLVAKEVKKKTEGYTKKAYAILGWKPEITIEEGLKTIVDYARKIA